MASHREDTSDQNRGVMSQMTVVSGASSGIGEGCARFLGEMGARVALLDVNEEAGARAAAAMGEGAVFVKCDVTCEDDCRSAVETVKSRWGRMDGLVNCAGVIRRDTTIGLSEEDWDISVDVSMKGAAPSSTSARAGVSRGDPGRSPTVRPRAASST